MKKEVLKWAKELYQDVVNGRFGIKDRGEVLEALNTLIICLSAGDEQ